MYECIHCRKRTVVWDIDASFESCGIEGDGVASFYHCLSCGASIIYQIQEIPEEE